jgi:hypothetical protein
MFTWLRQLFGVKRATPEVRVGPRVSAAHSVRLPPPTTVREADRGLKTFELDVFVFEDRQIYPTPIVGESFRQGEIEKLRAHVIATTGGSQFTAVLIPEPSNPVDANAVAVYAEGFGLVGYLSGEKAPRWAPLLHEFRALSKSVVGCNGIIRGDLRLGIWLNIRLSDVKAEIKKRRAASTPPA